VLSIRCLQAPTRMVSFQAMNAVDGVRDSVLLDPPCAEDDARRTAAHVNKKTACRNMPFRIESWNTQTKFRSCGTYGTHYDGNAACPC